MIKKILLVLIALFFGFFLLNCSDSSSNDPEQSSSSSAQVDASSSSDDVPSSSSSQVDTPSSSSDDTPSSSSSQVDTPSSSSDDTPSSSSSQGGTLETTLKAEPVATSNNPSEPKIVGSWTNEGKNYYVIDAGVIRKTFISAIFGPEHYDGYHPVSVAMKTINQSTITTSTTETISKSIAISNTLGVKLGLEEAIKASVPGVGDISAKLNLEVSETINVSNGKTKSTSISDITSFVQSQETSRTMTFGTNGAPAGYYRYALYGVSDVYFVIETSLDNQILLSWDVVSCVRSGDYLRHNDYSPNGDFDNSPSIESQIIFAEDFYKTLPPPPPPKIEKNERKEFIASGTYTFDKGFPATIEIYALGGGGGGQGGHTSDWINIIVPTTDHGTGGSGGGGAASYMKFDVTNTTIFGITVGTGGGGGSTFYAGQATNWESGYGGSNGGATNVTWDGKTLTAAGGQGGGHNRSVDSNRGLAGGSGGATSSMSEAISVSGGKGGDGIHKEQRTGQGGSTGRITVGSVNPFPSISGKGVGGSGGYTRDQPGSKGSDGFVVIVVKYYE